jgi:hypothetical protein
MSWSRDALWTIEFIVMLGIFAVFLSSAGMMIVFVIAYILWRLFFGV